MDDTATTLELPNARDAQETVERALFEIRRVIAGQDRMLERVLVCLLSGGHLLIEGVPGLAKTLTIKTAASALGGTFQRIQFTPDLEERALDGLLRGSAVGQRERRRRVVHLSVLLRVDSGHEGNRTCSRAG